MTQTPQSPDPATNAIRPSGHSRLARLCFPKGDHLRATHDHASARMWLAKHNIESPESPLAGHIAVKCPTPFYQGKPAPTVLDPKTVDRPEWRTHIDIEFSERGVEEVLRALTPPNGTTWQFGPAEGLHAPATPLEGEKGPAVADPDGLHVYGANCTWHGPIDQTARMRLTAPKAKESEGMPGIPCCPCCGGVLFQMSEAEWDKAIHTHMQKEGTRPDYRDFIAWCNEVGRCWPLANYLEAAEAYDQTMANLLEGLSKITVLEIKHSPPDTLMVDAATDPRTGAWAGYVFAPNGEGRPYKHLISTPAVFMTAHGARAHMRRVIAAARIWDEPAPRL